MPRSPRLGHKASVMQASFYVVAEKYIYGITGFTPLIQQGQSGKVRRVRRVRIPFLRSTFLPSEAGAVRSIRFPTFFVRFNLRLSLFREEKLCIRILLNISCLVFMRKSHLNQFGRRRILRLESELQERIEFTTIRVLARMLQPTSCWRLYGEQGRNLLVIITTPVIVIDIQNLLPPTCDLYRTRISYSGN